MKTFRMMLLLFAASIVLVGSPSCSKKLTKVQAQPSLSNAEKQAESPSIPQDRSSFDTASENAQMRSILQTVYFDYNKSDLSSVSIDRLGIIAKMLREHQSTSILVEGNCDERGSSEYNMGLGQRRAQAVKSWLMSYGISDKRIETTSFGKERPAYPNCQDDQCHAKNRRDEFKLLRPPSA